MRLLHCPPKSGVVTPFCPSLCCVKAVCSVSRSVLSGSSFDYSVSRSVLSDCHLIFQSGDQFLSSCYLMCAADTWTTIKCGCQQTLLSGVSRLSCIQCR